MRTLSMLSLSALVWMAACGAPERDKPEKKGGSYVGTSGKAAPSPAPAGNGAASQAGHDHGSHDHGGAASGGTYEVTGDHAHGTPPNGGIVATAGDKHVEIVPHGGDHLAVFLFDDAMKPLPIAGATGKLKLMVGGAISESALAPDGDHLRGMVGALNQMAPDAGKATVLLDLTIGGKPYSARYEYTPAAKPAGDAVAHMHDARHGGQVGMSGETHLEVAVAAPGEYRVYLSDAHRAPLAASLGKDAKITLDPDGEKPVSLPLAADPKGEYLVAKGEPRSTPTVDVKIEMSLNGAPVAMEFQLPTGSK